jgi:hypothetical protein
MVTGEVNAPKKGVGKFNFDKKIIITQNLGLSVYSGIYSNYGCNCCNKTILSDSKVKWLQTNLSAAFTDKFLSQVVVQLHD